MIVRKAKVEEAPALNRLLFNLMVRFEKMDSFDRQDRSYWKNRNTAAIRKVIRARDKDFIVIEENKKIVALIELVVSKREGIFKIKNNGHIETTFVGQKYRGKGYGKILVNEAVKWFKKRKLRHITVGTHAKDIGANSFWKKRGFKEYNIKYRK